MQTCRRFWTLICAGLLTAALYGCGSSTTKETVPSTATIFYSHSVIFRNNSTMTMGYNEFGQLGDGTLENREQATLVPGLGHMTKAAAGAEHTLAFSNHTSVVMAWGYNGYGQLGNDDVSTFSGNAYSSVPVPVQLGGDVTDVAAGGFHSLAVAGGGLYAWGYNVYGQVGNGNTTKQDVPVKVEKDVDDVALGTAQRVAAGAYHSLAVTSDGSVYAWGRNKYGQLGFSPYSTSFRTRPKKVPLPGVTGKVEEIAAGGEFSLALEVMRDGDDNIVGQRLWGWGFGGVGQLGLDPLEMALMLVANDPETAYSYQPVQIYATTGADAPFIKKFVAGSDHILLLLGARDNDGSDGTWTVQALGFNFYGQLGNNTFVDSFTRVNTLNSAGTAVLAGVTDIAAFGQHSLARVNGAWYGWGNNAQGQLGNPPPLSSAQNPRLPVLVPGF